MGVALGLPLLDAMVPALTAAAQSAARPKYRFGAIYVPHGMIMDQWVPATLGPLELKPILMPLAAHKERMLVVSNLARPETGSDTNHAGAPASWLSGVAPKRTDGPDFRLGVTVDQVIAGKIGQDTTFPSLEVATEDFTALLGSCAPGFSCAYANTLSWQGPTSPLPMEINPRVLFERMFGGGATATSAAPGCARTAACWISSPRTWPRSRRGIGASDRQRLGQYLDNVREVERRIQRAEAQAQSSVEVPDAPIGVPESYEEHVGVLYELLALAYEIDLTRVFTFMMARELSQRTYPHIDATLPHHMLSHHANNPERIAAHARVNTYHVSLFAKFVQRLASTPDGDGSLLDHSMIVYGSGMGNGNVHAAYPLPMMVVGGKALVHGNRHVAAPENSPNANLMLGMLDRFDIEDGRVRRQHRAGGRSRQRR